MAWSDEQQINAQLIQTIGREVGASDRDILIAVMTAMQESDLTNIAGGDRDSAGLFQQRPSMGWGTYEQVTSPDYAIRTFFQGRPGNPGLFSIKDRDKLSLTQAAQKVQRSAFPDAYAKHEVGAQDILGIGRSAMTPTVNGAPGAPVITGPADATPEQAKENLTEAQILEVTQPDLVTPAGQAARPKGGGDPSNPAGAMGVDPAGAMGVTPVGTGDVLDLMPQVSTVDPQAFNQEFLGGGTPYGGDGYLAPGLGVDLVSGAMSFIGTPYAWGGNGYSGIDCSGLVQQVYRGMGIELPRISSEQARSGEQIDMKELRPGDLVAWDNSVRNAGADHISIYVGNGEIIEALRPGLAVRKRRLDESDYNGWGVRMTRSR